MSKRDLIILESEIVCERKGIVGGLVFILIKFVAIRIVSNIITVSVPACLGLLKKLFWKDARLHTFAIQRIWL